jgi:hypothetical protein
VADPIQVQPVAPAPANQPITAPGAFNPCVSGVAISAVGSLAQCLANDATLLPAVNQSDVAHFDVAGLKQFTPDAAGMAGPSNLPVSPVHGERAPAPLAPTTGGSGGGQVTTDAPGLIACLAMISLLALLAKRSWAYISDRIPSSLAQFIIVPPA